ncbi:MAG TPA: hypothetical protein DCE42_09215 [Myxococcales bacterium]|nr:hypothetical protein [Deltaproteobacteria bacterium]MBU53455.1 hypothetical protein [Deltaproteobacteria bacterium]HAA54925.1 hypothetical protein [Myxococcales bacterium]
MPAHRAGILLFLEKERHSLMKVGLRGKLSIALVSLALIPLVVVTMALVRVNVRSLEDSAKNYRLAVAHNAVNAVRGTLEMARSELLTARRILRQKGLDVSERMRLLRAALAGADVIQSIAIFSAKGQLADSFVEKGKTPYIDAPKRLSKKVMKAALAQTVHYLKSQKGQKGQFAIPFVIPVRLEGGRLFGFLWASIPIHFLHKKLKKLSALRFEKQSDRIFVIDSESHILSHGKSAMLGQKVHKKLDEATRFVRQGLGYTLKYDKQGVAYIAALEPITELGWIVVAQDDIGKVFASVRITLQRALIVGSVFALLALMLGLWMGQRLAEPVLSVSEAASKVASGDFRVRVNVPSHDEVGEMARSFNQMATDLQGYETQLIEETRIRTDLSRYLNVDLVEDIVDKRLPLKLGGERKEVTVMFADVVAFTPLTEQHAPEKIVAILNELFTFLTEIVFKHDGIIDKFLGDCVMAVWGAPVGDEEDAFKAVRAAEEMLRWLEVGNSRWKKELGVTLNMAIGINIGEAVVGNIGSEKRMEYTVIGDSVNIAARLESLARPGQILMTQALADHVEEEFDCESLGNYQMPDGKRSIELFTIVD